MGNLKIFVFCLCIISALSNAGMILMWLKWDGRNSPVSVLSSCNGNMHLLCLQARQRSSRLSCKLRKTEFVLPHKHKAWLLLPLGPHLAAASSMLPSTIAYFVYAFDPRVSPGCGTLEHLMGSVKQQTKKNAILCLSVWLGFSPRSQICKHMHAQVYQPDFHPHWRVASEVSRHVPFVLIVLVLYILV